MKKALLALVLLTACARAPGPDQIVKINIIDSNGMNETIQAKERLARYQKLDFLSPQPYAKVLRVYGASPDGSTRSVITSYHSNGHVCQSLDVVDGRACGRYAEWYPDGMLKLDAQVIGGRADIDPVAVQSFVFDGLTSAYDERGQPLAQIPYQAGLLHGTSRYFAPMRIDVSYDQGLCHGPSTGSHPNEAKAFVETYDEGRLSDGQYWDSDGTLLCTIEKGNGTRASWEDGMLSLETYRDGVADGKVEEYGRHGELLRQYTVADAEKMGEEIEYYPDGGPKLSVNWQNGQIQGIARTWYKGGQLQSQREMTFSRKNGVSMAWYRDGQLMFLEEYRDDKLVKGEYFPKGSNVAVTRVQDGEGCATLYDEMGNFLSRVLYCDGRPREDQA